jgi:hypothetical protein
MELLTELLEKNVPLSGKEMQEIIGSVREGLGE